MGLKHFQDKIQSAQNEIRFLVVPRIGYPGLNIRECSIKLAQQNYGEHFKVNKAIAKAFKSETVLPVMDLSEEAKTLGRYTLFPKDESASIGKDTFSFDELTTREEIHLFFDTRLLGYVETVKPMSIGLQNSILKGAYLTGPSSLAALLMGADEAAMTTIEYPDKMEGICQFTTEKIQEYVQLPIAAGIQIICIPEPSAVMLSPNQFWRFSAAYIHYINESCRYSGVATVYFTCGNTMHLIRKMVDSGADGISLYSSQAGVNLPAVTTNLRPDILIFGNINYTGTLLHGQPDEVEKEVPGLLKRISPFANFYSKYRVRSTTGDTVGKYSCLYAGRSKISKKHN